MSEKQLKIAAFYGPLVLGSIVSPYDPEIGRWRGPGGAGCTDREMGYIKGSGYGVGFLVFEGVQKYFGVVIRFGKFSRSGPVVWLRTGAGTSTAASLAVIR